MAPVLDADERTTLHSLMTAWTCQQLHQIGQYQLWVDGDCQHPLFSQLKSTFSIECHQQQGENLGERMADAIRLGFNAFQPVIIVGSDCPLMTVNYLQQAIVALQKNDVVFGPASDGGYVLLGLSQFVNELFVDIPWGTENVLSLSLARAKTLKLSHTLLSMLPDIDRPEDLHHLADEKLPVDLQAFAHSRV